MQNIHLCCEILMIVNFNVSDVRRLLREASNAAYEILGVPRNASSDDIKRAYRTKAVALHPDRNPGVDTTAKMAKLNVAYGILSNPAKRSKYDSVGDRTVDAAIPSTTAPRPAEPRRPMGDPPGAKASETPWDRAAREKRERAQKARDSQGRAESEKARAGRARRRADAEDRDWFRQQAARNREQEASKNEWDQGNRLYFTFIGGTSKKFWAVATYNAQKFGYRVRVQWGRIGTQGQEKTHKFDSKADADVFIRKTIESKLAKGYKRTRDPEGYQPPPPSKEEPKTQTRSQDTQRSTTGKTTYRVYGPHKGKPASAHYKGHIYTPTSTTKFKSGMKANMGLGSDGRLGVSDPESGHTQAWDVDENREVGDMLIEYVLHCFNEDE